MCNKTKPGSEHRALPYYNIFCMAESVYGDTSIALDLNGEFVVIPKTLLREKLKTPHCHSWSSNYYTHIQKFIPAALRTYSCLEFVIKKFFFFHLLFCMATDVWRFHLSNNVLEIALTSLFVRCDMMESVLIKCSEHYR